MFGTRIQTFSSINRCRLTCADLDWNKQLGISVSVNADIALLKAISHVSLMKLNSGLTLPFYWRQRRVTGLEGDENNIVTTPGELVADWRSSGMIFYNCNSWLVPDPCQKCPNSLYCSSIFYCTQGDGDGLQAGG